jgi:hypothetical protein
MNSPPLVSTNISKKKSNRDSRLLKKQQFQRTELERQTEIDKVYNKLHELGITNEMVEEFTKITNAYIKFGTSASGRIKIIDINRELAYLLSNDKRHEVITMLRAIA